MANQKTPLLAQDPTSIPLYDPQAMIQMDRSIAYGYIVFLMGGDPAQIRNKRRCEENETDQLVTCVDLGFSAITQGNVVEACFGISHNVDPRERVRGVESAASRTFSQVRTVKALLEEAAEIDEAVRMLAVTTYLRAFEIVTILCDEREQLNCLTRCFFYHRVTNKAQVELQNNFLKLQEVLQLSNLCVRC